jgi:hypothetical protein
MTTRPWTLAVVAAVLITVAAFGAGFAFGNNAASHPTVLTGDGYVGADQASLEASGRWYGFRSSVRWTDGSGAYHEAGWPACLPRLQSVTGIRFAGATLWAGNVGSADVIWVDCQTP